jgi:hypothetical protein
MPTPTRLSTYVTALLAVLHTLRRPEDPWTLSAPLPHPDGYGVVLTDLQLGQTFFLLFLEDDDPSLPLAERDGILVGATPAIPQWFLPVVEAATSFVAHATDTPPIRLQWFLRPLLTRPTPDDSDDPLADSPATATLSLPSGRPPTPVRASDPLGRTANGA